VAWRRAITDPSNHHSPLGISGITISHWRRGEHLRVFNFGTDSSDSREKSLGLTLASCVAMTLLKVLIGVRWIVL
jgi:hypothetical protein